MIGRIKQLKPRYLSLLTQGTVPSSNVLACCYSDELLNFYKDRAEILNYSSYSLNSISDSNTDSNGVSKENSNNIDPDFSFSLESLSPKISLILTIKNEEFSLPSWFDSLLTQTKLPDEIIVCDGGSTDKTVAILRLLFNKLPNSISRKIILASEFGSLTCSIAAGRNRAVERAQHDIIAVSDLGCELDQNWLYRITLPLIKDKELDIAMGWNEPIAKSKWSRAFSKFLLQGLETIEPKFYLASARSLAFKKSLWSEIGGFPEYLSFAGEDTLFSYYAKFFSKKAVFVPEALVFWSMPKNLKSLCKTVYRYAKGDAEGGKLFFPHYLRLIRVYLFSALGFIAAFLLAGFGLFFANSNISFIALAIFLISTYPVVRLILDYRPFSIKHSRISEKIYLGASAFLMSVSQLLGYLSGCMNRKIVEEGRLTERTSQCIISIPPDSNLTSSVVRKFVVDKILEGYFVVLVKPLLMNIDLDHPALNVFISGHFDKELWSEKSKGFSVTKEFSEIDILNFDGQIPIKKLKTTSSLRA